MKKPTLIAICGATASGKTGLSLSLARWLRTDILSYDSRQFYKELLIGAAPPMPTELSLVKHHFIQHLSIKENYNAGRFERDAIEFLDEYFKTQNTIITVGGSGMFLNALTHGFDELPENTSAVRAELNAIFKNEGLETLQKELLEKDPDYYHEVDLKNHVRVIRALEVIRITNQPYSLQRKRKKKQRNFDVIKIGIDYPREELYARINHRVDLMMEAGLLEEVKMLHPHKANNALQTVGYNELFNYLDGKFDLDIAISEIKKNSRRYAKRQNTWFKKDLEINWIKPDDLDAAKQIILAK